MKPIVRWSLVGAAALAVAAAVAFRLPSENAKSADGRSLANVERRTLEIAVEATGLVEPIRVVEVKSRASGEVLQVRAETGDRVEAGALLAEIDPRDVQNALSQAEADLASARVGAAIAQAQSKRMSELLAQGVAAQRDLDTATDAEASARAAVVRAETNLQLARERRGDVTIRAPIGGTVIDRQVEPGQIIASATANVSGGTTLFRMADLGEMRVRAKIDETDIGRIRPGQPVRLTVEAYAGRNFQGAVEKIEPQAVVEQNVTMFPVLVRLSNEEGLLLPGMSAEISIEIARRENVLTIPNGAVVALREAANAASTVGLTADDVRAALQRTTESDNVAPGAPPASSAGPTAEECGKLRDKLRSGGGFESLADPERALLRKCRELFGGGRGSENGGATARGANDGSERRPALVFVETAAAVQPRRVLLGLADWDYTEVVEGLTEGDQVILISLAQIQRQQQEMEQRIRARSGALGPGTGSAPRTR